MKTPETLLFCLIGDALTLASNYGQWTDLKNLLFSQMHHGARMETLSYSIAGQTLKSHQLKRDVMIFTTLQIFHFINIFIPIFIVNSYKHVAQYQTPTTHAHQPNARQIDQLQMHKTSHTVRRPYYLYSILICVHVLDNKYNN